VENNESIIFRSGLTMSGIVLLALLSMISSIFIAESSKGDAAAINLAGSLRMQSYRIATRLQQPTALTPRSKRWNGRSASSNGGWISCGEPALFPWRQRSPSPDAQDN
jgi:nitrate/nitrite-specific signal transduction histidine kinase